MRTASTIRTLNHTEEVTVWIFEDHKVAVWPVSPRITSRSERYQPLHVGISIAGVEIEMQSTSLARAPCGNTVQGHVRPFAPVVSENHPPVACGFSGHVVG